MAEKDVTGTGAESPENQQKLDINSDENQYGSTHLNEPVSTEPELEKLRAELEEAKDRYLRLAAEFDNFRRRTAKERIELIQTAGKEVIADLLPILDDFDRANKQFENADVNPSYKEGMILIFHKFKQILGSKGLKPMDATGNEFDADLHEAITEIPAPSPEMTGKVIDEVEKGYYLGEKIIRHAKVVVGK